MARLEWLTPSAWVLIAANLIPVGGVLLLGWGVFDVLLLYWTENVVIPGSCPKYEIRNPNFEIRNKFKIGMRKFETAVARRLLISP